MVQRWLSILLGAGVVAVAVLLVANRRPQRLANSLSLGDAGISEGALDATASAQDALDAGFTALPTSAVIEDTRDSGVGSRMPDGSPVPALGERAPRQVRFGVVLVTYAGAQGAPPGARSKHDAKVLADKFAIEAKTDFHAAVLRGDQGSTDDAGHVPRGVLELASEYFLFTLPVGSVSDAIETPRGYWIVKRLE